MYSNKISTSSFFVLLSITCIYATCHKHLDCRETVYNFEIGIKAYPDRDSINVGDTIWLEVNEPTTLKDVISGNMVNYIGAANLGCTIGFQQFSNQAGQFTIDAAQKLIFFLAKGNEIVNRSPSLYKEYLFTEANNYYVFKLGVIPKETGIFRLVFSNADNVYRKNDECTKAGFHLNFKNTDQHFYFYPGGAGTSPGGGTYYFKVY